MGIRLSAFDLIACSWLRRQLPVRPALPLGAEAPRQQGEGMGEAALLPSLPESSWTIASRARDSIGRWQEAFLFRAGDPGIRRHVKLSATHGSMMSFYEACFEERRKLQRNAMWRNLKYFAV